MGVLLMVVVWYVCDSMLDKDVVVLVDVVVSDVCGVAEHAVVARDVAEVDFLNNRYRYEIGCKQQSCFRKNLSFFFEDLQNYVCI